MPFDEGLTDAEVLRAETKYDIHFPDDLREFLQTALPSGYPIYPDWRSGEEEWIRGMLRRPLDGILFDVEHNDFWLPEWGARPLRTEVARTVVEKYVSQAPRLIPIYGHRMMPDRPQLEGNPVLSPSALAYGCVISFQSTRPALLRRSRSAPKNRIR
jgi:hypothetical protein